MSLRSKQALLDVAPFLSTLPSVSHFAAAALASGLLSTLEPLNSQFARPRRNVTQNFHVAACRPPSGCCSHIASLEALLTILPKPPPLPWELTPLGPRTSWHLVKPMELLPRTMC